MGSTSGVMVKNIKDSGRIIKCMDKVNFGGQMEKNTLVILKRIKGMAMESSSGKMAENTKVSGLEESSMASAYTGMPRVKKERDNGLKVKELTGFELYILILLYI